MRRVLFSFCALLFVAAALALVAGDAYAIPRDGGAKPAASAGKSGKNGDGKDFAEVVKDYRKVEGLFDLYINDEESKMYFAIKPDQLNVVYMCGVTRNAGDGSYYDSGSMGGEFPFYLMRVGEKIQMMIKNVLFRADEKSAASRAIERGLSNSLFNSAKVVEAKEGPKGEILVDAADLFLFDVGNTSYFLGSAGKTGFSFDRGNSYFGTCKSFPQNTEIDVNLYFQTSRPNDALYLMSPYSMIHTYHFSLSTLPETGYRPRLADDRVGHFLTLYQDYSNMDAEDPYVRYVSRWHLEKEEPYAEMSKPKQPIVFWLENTIPEEYRKSVAEGVLFWNKSFEKIGFKDAMVVKQMPDDADWDPADVRYNTVRWIIMPGGGYAVGPSRTNPFTGQIYDADIRISSDFLRYMFNYVETAVKPIAFGADGNPPETEWEAFFHSLNPRQKQMFCNFGSELAMEAGYAYSVLEARNTLEDKDEVTKKFVHEYTVDLVSHEVGHTLGFRHNFKASTMNTVAQLCDEEYTDKNGLIGTCMDYTPANIAPEGKTQGAFFNTTPGPYDDWVIEYAYKPLDATTPEGEIPELRKIAERAAEAGLQYGTDEDALGGSVRSIDPTCNYFDIGADPMVYYRDRVAMTNELWAKMEDHFSQDNTNYSKFRRVFASGWRGYREAAGNIAKYIGGYYHNRSHVGDPGATVPYTPVPASEQLAAINFLNEKIFAADAFKIQARLLNKLQAERYPDFAFSVWTMPRIDYPVHDAVLNIQRSALFKIYAATTLDRIHDQELQFAPGAEKVTMADVFRGVRRGIWTEVQSGGAINSYRRNLQLEHLNILKMVYLNVEGA
ncbi:MAG TPA: zinc-dependent metalloprotease, partial [candidate division Zixibacteria bacterium]|nr:zinc-dependent metalloprotease [candidate division Zixibacteria bacterium]